MARPELAPDAPLRGGMLLPHNEELPPVPLEHTAINAEVTGPLAVTTVAQRFRNTHHAPLDALYVFPLPLEAAVSELVLRIGERVIRGQVRERSEAEASYRAAAEQGASAVLLAQERPNLFSVELANLQPDEVVEVELRFFSQVPFDDGWFTLAIPTVVLPRYLPEGEPATPKDGVVPLLPAGSAAHTLSLRVSLELGLLAEVTCLGLDMDIHEERGRSVATLRDPLAVPDRDVVLRYRPAGAGYAAAAFAYREAGRAGAVLLMLTPRAVPAMSEVLPRELLFVFDRSGSMAGESIAQARNALRACLRALNPGDSFNIFPFDNQVERLAAVPLAFAQQSVDQADAFIAQIEARGGTEIVGALNAALDQPRDPHRLRVIVFLTDGAVGNEDAVLRALAGRLNEARVFAFGVGSAVNRFLLDRLAVVGRGSAEYMLPNEPIEPAVQRFQRRTALPLVRDLTVNWGGASVTDVLPEPLPDLYAGQPLVLLARYTGARDQQASVTVSGRTAHGSFSERLALALPIATPDRHGAWAALPKLWAHARLVELDHATRLDQSRDKIYVEEAKALALEHGLLSAHTAFVASEEPPPNAAERRASERVIVPVHLSAGTRREAFEPTRLAQPGGSWGVMYAMAAPPAPGLPHAYAHRQTPGVAQKFRNALLSGLAQTEAATASSPDRGQAAPYLGGASEAARLAPALSNAQRRAAALRFLARTQDVSGAWADDETATVLAVLAFALAGHTARIGDFRPQLTRAEAWLQTRQTTSPGSELSRSALRALAGEPLDRATLRPEVSAIVSAVGLDQTALAQQQRLGGDADGAVLTSAASHLRPGAEALCLTAALAMLLD